MLITNINDFKKKIYEAVASSINFSTISSDTINFWNDIKTLGVDLNEFKKFFIEKFGEQSYKVLEAKLSSDQLASNYEDSNTELETTEFVNEFDSIIDFCNSYLVTYSANNTLVTNENTFKPKKPKYDITQSEKSLASAVAPLISKMEIMPLPDLKTEFTNILKDPSVHASEATRKKWFDTLTKATNKYSLMSAITNLYLKAAKLGLTESVENNIELKKYLSDEEIYEVAYKLKQFFRTDVDLKKLSMMIKANHYDNDLFPLGNISHITKALNSTSDNGTRLYLRTGLMTAFKDKGINIYQEPGLNTKDVKLTNIPSNINTLHGEFKTKDSDIIKNERYYDRRIVKN